MFFSEKILKSTIVLKMIIFFLVAIVIFFELTYLYFTFNLKKQLQKMTNSNGISFKIKVYVNI